LGGADHCSNPNPIVANGNRGAAKKTKNGKWIAVVTRTLRNSAWLPVSATEIIPVVHKRFSLSQCVASAIGLL
jgi:hypothetical protein